MGIIASRELKVEIIGDSRSLQRALGQAGDSATGFGSKFAKAGKVVGAAALGVGAAVTAGFVYTLKRGFDELAESQKVMAQTEAVLKSTGGVANVTAKEVEGLAGSLSKMTGIDDEAIQANENLLLTFKNVRNEVGKGNDIFDRATKASLDLSTAGFGSLDSAAKMLGKALNDPVKGLTAMGRAGVTFSAEQKETIKTLVESGKTLDAQKIILKELESQVGGSAKAYGETLPGQLAKARNAFDEIAGNLATKFLPMLTSILEWVNAHWPQISAVIDTVGNAIIATFGAIGTAVNYLRGQWEIHRESVIKAWTAVRDGILAFIAWFKANVVPAIQNVISAAIAIWNNFGGEIRSVLTLITNIIRTSVQNFLAPIKIFLALLRGDWSAAWDEVKGVVSRTLGQLVNIIRTLGSAIVSAAIEIGKGIIRGIVEGLAGIAGKVGEQMQKLWDNLKTAATTALGFARDIGAAVITGIYNAIKEKIDWLKEKIEGLLGFLKDLSPFSSVEEGGRKYIGEPIMTGAGKGVDEGAPALSAKAAEAARKAVAAAESAVSAAKSSLSTAWQQLAADAMRAFDAQTDKGLANIRTKLAKELAKIEAQLQAALDKIETRREQETPSERALREMDEGIAREDRAAALASAESALAAAVTPEEVAAAQKQLLDAQRAIARAALEEQARIEREAADAKAKLATERAQREAAQATTTETNASATRERNYAAQREQMRRNHELFLEKQWEMLEKHPEQWARIHARIMRKFKAEFGPDFVSAGKELGLAFGRGLMQGINEVEDGAQMLAKLIADYLKLNSPAKKGPLSTLDKWAQPFAKTWASGLDTRGIVGGMGMPGIAPMAAAGGGSVVFNFPNYVGDKRELQMAMQEAAGDWMRRNGSAMFG